MIASELAVKRKQAVTSRARARRTGMCKPTSTPSSWHSTSKSTTSSDCSACAGVPADHPASPTPSWSAWLSPRSCSTATPSVAGCGSPVAAWATSSRTFPSRPPTTGGCAPPTRSSSTPSGSWPASPPPGGISSGSSTRHRSPAAPLGRRSSAPRSPDGPTTATAPPHSRHFWGLRLHLLTTPDGAVVLWCLATPKLGDREVARAMLAAARASFRPGLLIVADKGYAGREFEDFVRQLGATLVRPDRRGERQRYG